MAKKGKSFEELVEKLEKLLASNDIQVERDVKLVDKSTGGDRQIDVLLRAKTGIYEFIVIIECRDRSKTDDVTWIEQLATKGRDVNANKIIAVSKSGFSKNAVKKARQYSITLRQIDDAVVADLTGWFKISAVKISRIQAQLAQIGFVPLYERNLSAEEKEMITSQLSAVLGGISKPFLHVPKTGQLISVNDLWLDFEASNTDVVDNWISKLSYNDIPALRENITFTMHETVEILGVKDFIVKHVELGLHLTLVKFPVSVKRAVSYLEDGNALVNLVQLEEKIDNRDFSIDISKANEKIEIDVKAPPGITLSVENYSEEKCKRRGTQ